MKLEDLNHKKIASNPHQFEYLTTEGEPSGFMIKVVGRESEVFTKRAAAIEQDYVKAKTRKGFEESTENDERVIRLAAARVVGWSGIDDEYSESNAEKLCQINSHAMIQILAKSNSIANFTKL